MRLRRRREGGPPQGVRASRAASRGRSKGGLGFERGLERAFGDLNGALNVHPKPARSFQRSCEALKGWFERPCGAFKGEDGRFKSPSNGRLEPLNTRGGGVQKAPSPLKSGPLRSGALAPQVDPGRGRGGPRGSLGVGAPKRPQRRPFQRVRTAFERLRWGWGPGLEGPVRACTPMHAHPCTAMYGDVRPCTGMHGDARSPLYGDVRRCTPVHARPCTPMHGGACPCTEVYG